MTLGQSPTFTPPWVQHMGDKLTACRCSSSYRATTWAVGNKWGGKGWKRRGQTQSKWEKVKLGGNNRGKIEACYCKGRQREVWRKGETLPSSVTIHHAENNRQSMCVYVCVCVCVCVCNLEQLHQSLQLYHQLPPALLQRRHPLLQLIFPLSATQTNLPLLSHNRVSGGSK